MKFFVSEEINNNLNTEIDDLKKKLENANAKTIDLEKDLKNKEKELSDLSKFTNEKISSLSSELEHGKTKISELEKSLDEKDKIIEEQTGHVEKLKAQLFELKPSEILVSDVTAEVRVKCVKCGAVGKDIKIIEDKTKVLSYIGNLPMYAKKHVCKKCGYEF